jgi:pto-interacting protein 1
MVYRASLRTGRAAAAKRFIGRGWRACYNDLALMRRRLSAASRLRHPNVVRLLRYTATLDLCVILYEFADMGTLHDALHGSGGGALSWAQRVLIALYAARGLTYLHGAAVTHGGVRSSKVLMFPGFRAKIAHHDVLRELDDDDHAQFAHVSIFAYLQLECVRYSFSISSCFLLLARSIHA